MNRLFLAASLVFIFCLSASAQNTDRPLLISRLALNQTHIAFTYAGKIWLVARSGGAAKRLTDTPFEETNPVFSPDGRRLAFSRLNGNDWDVYVVSADGSGEPQRITMMPEDDMVTSWTPDGKELIFETTRDEETLVRLYKTSVDQSQLATPLPLHQSFQGSMSPDGRRLAFNPRGGAGDWRYYRGGYAAPLWITDLKTGTLEKVSDGTFNDKSPIWVGDRIYFVSDRTGIFNLYSYDTTGRRVQQHTHYADQGVRVASVFGDTAAYIQRGHIHLFNLKPAGADIQLNVTVSPDTIELTPREAPAARNLEYILPSATGDRISIGARGDAFVFDAANGSYKNVTNTPGIAERYPVLSPDGRSVAYFSDESGEYQLHVRSLENDTVKKIAVEQKPTFYWDLKWSPDSRQIAFAGRRLDLWLADVDSGSVAKIDTSSYSAQESWTPNFSHDSRFLTYSKRLKNRVGTIYIYDIAAKKAFQATDGVTHAQMPVFDANGKYLYFVSSLNAGTSEFSWGVLNGVLANPLLVRRVHAIALTKDQPSLLIPNDQPNPEAKISEVVPQVKIDFDGLEHRVVNLPVRLRDYSQLAMAKPGVLILGVNEWSRAPGDLSTPRQAVYTYNIGVAYNKVVDEIDAFDVTADGNKILYRKGRDFFLASSNSPAKPDEGKQDFSKLMVRVVPSEEWRQIFHESIRIMRDWFYDPNYHGQNLKALEMEYAQYLPTTVRRSDLNRLMSQMLGSVSVSHLGVGGGDARQPGGGGNPIGLLGADYEISDGKYRFKKIYRSTTFASPAGTFTAPLDAPSVGVREGDYLLRVNDQPVDATKNVLEFFANTIGRPTKITVSSAATGSNPRTYTVFPTNGENRLRRANWAEENRKVVEKMSGGKLGYIFIEGYSGEGIMNAVRGLTGYGDKQGVIIDQRFNGGGITPDYLIEWMQRRPLYYYMFRGGEDIATPVNPAPPVKVMIVNELNGSAAETGAFMFKLGKVGATVGKRTFGGGIGPYYFTPNFTDGGSVRLPNRAAYDPSGSSWGIENIGVVPDYDIEITPQDVMAGRDPQLLKAIDVAMAALPKNPMFVAKRPSFPVHPGAQTNVAATDSILLPPAGSAFELRSPPPVANQTTAASAVSNSKIAAYIGRYDANPQGLLTILEEGGKLYASPNNGERAELVPADGTDIFTAVGPGATVKFERDAAGKVTGLTVTMPNGNTIKGRRVD